MVSNIKANNWHLSNYGKREIAKSMYFKGRDFILAGLLLKQHMQSHGFVSIHLVCQGLEIILKSKLLLKDFDKYKDLIKSRTELGHDLVKLVDCWKKECNRNKINKGFYDEVKPLNEFYKRHRLRYGTVTDLLFNPKEFQVVLTSKQLLKLISVTDKELAV